MVGFEYGKRSLPPSPGRGGVGEQVLIENVLTAYCKNSLSAPTWEVWGEASIANNMYSRPSPLGESEENI